MATLINIAIVIITIIGMEALSWTIHKYLFHGPLWFIHQSHHQPHSGYFEWNDIFSLGFAALALSLIWIGHNNLNYYFWIGTGISIYGMIYFIFHDWFIHNRIKAFKSNNLYLWAIKRAHKIHHKSLKKTPSSFFGLLWVSKKKLNLPKP
jgi:beta-carotene 3-hydroxylase